MIELDRFQGVVVFATNLQENYDDAFVRRIAAHVRFSLPDEKTRLRIWHMYMPDTLPRSADVDLDKLADLSENFSPADIAIAVRQAAVMAAIRSGDSQRVFLADLKKAIDKIQNAKREVGTMRRNSDESVSIKNISASEVPNELKHKANQNE